MTKTYRTIILARMGEIALKGLNRGKFERQLIDNLRWRLKEYGAFSIVQSQSRIWIEPKDSNPDLLEDKETASNVLRAVTQVFGLVSASLVWKFSGDMESIKEHAVKLTDEILSAVSGSDLILLESNHDVGMLQTGPYPYAVKRRILSDKGHLCNEVCAETAVRLLESGTTRFCLAHLSRDNNMPRLAYQTTYSEMLLSGASEGTDYLLRVAGGEPEMMVL